MPASVRSRETTRSSFQQTRGPAYAQRQPHSATTKHDSPTAFRLIGAPIPLVVPRLCGVRPRYCQHSDEAVAAVLAASLLRIGLALPSDYEGSAVDMISSALNRLSRKAGGFKASQWLSSEVAISDLAVYAGEYERAQSGKQFADGDCLFLRVTYTMAQVMPLRSLLKLMETESPLLPAAFFMELNGSLGSFTRVYSALDVEDIVCDEDDEEDTLLADFRNEMPLCLQKSVREQVTTKVSRRLLKQFKTSAADPEVRQAISLALRICELAKPYEKSGSQTTYEFEDFEVEDPLEGIVLAWDRNDAIHGSFDESAQCRAQGGDFRPFLCLRIDLQTSEKKLDAKVRNLMNYVRDLAEAQELLCDICEILEDLDESRRRNRKL